MWIALTIACNAPDRPDERPEILPALHARGVVVLHVDTLRADHLPAYGYPRNTTPHLRLRPWRLVDGERATASWTMTSTASFLTSLEPEHHGLLWWEATGPNAELTATTWAAELGGLGWATGQFTGNEFASARTGLDAGFDVSQLRTKPDTGPENLAALSADLLAWLDTLPPDQPFMAHLQPMEMHHPYAPAAEDVAQFRTEPLPFPRTEADGWTEAGWRDAWEAAAEADRPAVDQGVVDLYDASLLGLDREIEDLLEALEERGLLDDTLVVLTSDHGETLDDPGDGVFGHKIAWREELVRLPLMFLHPDVPEGRVACLSENVDVWPTIAGALGIAAPGGLDGIDLAGGCRDRARGSLWSDAGRLTTIGAADTRGALQRLCQNGSTRGTAVGDGADPTETTPVADVPHGDGLNAAIDAYAASITTKYAEATCPG